MNILARNSKIILFVFSFFALMGVWEAVIAIFQIPHYILPTPRLIAHQFFVYLFSGFLFPHIWATLSEILIGFALATVIGTVLATLVNRFRFLNTLIHPYVVAFQATPKVAIAPIIIMWFGFEIFSKVVIVTAIAFFPIFVNTVAGLGSLTTKMQDLMNSYCATKWQIFWKARIPNAMPYIFAGLEIGMMMSLIGAIVGEFIGSSKGLGYLLVLWQVQLETASVFAVILTLVILGVTLYLITVSVKNHFLYWIDKI